MAKDFMNERFWDEPEGWSLSYFADCKDGQKTLRAGWKLAVHRLAGHLATKKSLSVGAAMQEAQDIIEETADSMMRFAPDIKKREVVEDVIANYLFCKDPEMILAMSTHLRQKVEHSETNRPPQTPAKALKKSTGPKTP